MKNVVGADAPRNLSATADGVVVDTLLTGDAAGRAVGLAEIVFAVFERESHFSVFNDVTEDDITLPNFDESKLRSRMPDMRLDLVWDDQCYAVASDELPLEGANLIARKGDMVFGVHILEEPVTYSDVPEEFAQNIPVGDGWDYQEQEGELHFLSELVADAPFEAKQIGRTESLGEAPVQNCQNNGWNGSVEARIAAAKEFFECEVAPFNDALCLGDWNAPGLSEALATPLSVMCATHCKTPGSQWVLHNTTRGGLLNDYWSRHPVEPEKDGNAVTPAEGTLARKKTSNGQTVQYANRIQDKIHSIPVLAIDVDTIGKAREVAKRLLELGFLSVVGTTHSHVEKRTLEGDRFRIFIFLDEPFTFPLDDKKARRERVQEWEGIYAGVVDLLGLEEIDASGMNLHQMMFTFRRPSEASEYEHYLIAGQPLRVETVAPGDPSKHRKGKSHGAQKALSEKDFSKGERPTLSNGFELVPWYFDGGRYVLFDVLLDLIAWDVRSGTPGDWTDIQCPNAHEHSDPEMDTAGFIMGEDGFGVNCFHDHCSGLSSLDFLVLIEKAILAGEAVLPDEYETLGDLLCDDSMFPSIDGKDLTFDPRDYGVVEEIDILWLSNAKQVRNAFKAVEENDRATDDHYAALFAGVEKAGNQRRASEKLAELMKGVERFGTNKLRNLEKRGKEMRAADLAAWKAEQDAEKRRKSDAKMEAEAEQRAGRTTPDYIPPEEATPETVHEAASAAKWLPNGFTHRNGWFGAVRDDKFHPSIREFEVVYSADGAKGSARTNQLTIRYQHRSKALGIVESMFRIGDTYKDSGTILGKLRNEGLEFHPNAKTDDILVLLRAVSSEREAVFCPQSGWVTPERDVYVSPTGKVVQKADDKRLFVLDHVMRVSAETKGTVEEYSAAADTVLRGKNAKLFLPGALLSAVGITADFLGTELAIIIANEGKKNSGKTTSLMAGVSMIAIASVRGLMFSANATETAFEAMAVKASGAAMVPDDSGASKRSADDEQRQIYQYANQMGRGRGTTTGGLQELNSWNGAMGISTERGLLTRLDAEGADAKSGVQSRVFTVNFENAETLDKTEDADLLAAYDVLAHGAKPTVENGVFGVAWQPFVRRLMELGVDEVGERVAAYEKAWGANAKGGERIVTTGALLAVAAEVCQEVGLFPANDDTLNLQDMLKEVLDETLEQRAGILDTARQASDSLRLQIIRAIGRGQIIAHADADVDGARLEILGRWTTTEKEAAFKEPNRSLRTYILPVDRLSLLGLKVELSALVEQLRAEDALVLPKAGTKLYDKGLWQSTPGEGSNVNSLRVSGAWVHGDDATPQNEES